MIFLLIVAIALAGYVRLSSSAMRMSNRSFYTNAAVDLAEIGVEQAMWALNRISSHSGAWSGWTALNGGTDLTRVFNDFGYAGGVAGEVRVHVKNPGPGAVVTSRAVITLKDGHVLEKWIQVKLKRRSLFAHALVARDKISAEGGVVFDSWNSDPDNDPSTPFIPWSESVSMSNATIAAASTDESAVRLKPSAIVYGTVLVGTESGADITYGSMSGAGFNAEAGLYQDWGTKVGNKDEMPSGSHPYLAQDALSTGFSASFEEIVAPEGATVVSSYVLPHNKTVVKSNQWSSWTENVYVSQDSIGETGAETILQMEKLTVEGAATLTIKGDVTLVLPSSGVETLKVTASGKVTLEEGASLTIYTAGDVDISGAGIANPSSPSALQIWSTRASGSLGQTIKLGGSGQLSGVIYAPDAAFSIPGGTNFFGAAVVYSGSFTGSGKFHYDESLQNYSFGRESRVEIGSYTELTTPELRRPYAEFL